MLVSRRGRDKQDPKAFVVYVLRSLSDYFKVFANSALLAFSAAFYWR